MSAPAVQSNARLSSPPLTLPKAVLYSNDNDPWSAAVLLTLHEKGYGDDEYDKREVDIVKGENFDLAYLRINGAGAVPTLVVPLDRYLGQEIESKYKSVSDIAKILDFLDHSRSITSRTHTTSVQPAPALAPATIDALSKSNILINLVHSPPMDLEFLYLSARTPEELARKKGGVEGSYISQRLFKLDQALNPPVIGDSDPNDPPPALTTRSRSMLEAKHTLLKQYNDAYNGSGSQAEFFAKSKTTWEIDVRAALELIEKTIKVSHVAVGEESVNDNHSESTSVPAAAGTGLANGIPESKPGGFILGEQLCLADLHLFPWLARLVYFSTGDLTDDGIKKLEGNVGAPIPERVHAFWRAMIARDSVKKVYSNGIY